MKFAWGMIWEKTRNRLKGAWLVTVGIVAIYIGAIAPMNEGRGGIATERGVAAQRASGLAASAQWEPVSFWRSASTARLARGMLAGVPAARTMAAKITADEGYGDLAADKVDDRKTIRTSSLEAITKNPRDTGEQIRKIAEGAGGFVENSQSYGEGTTSAISLGIRVPAAKFEEVRAAIRRLGLRVLSENLQAQDVTKQYVDQDARLRNLRAQAIQYLSILKSSKTVKDTLDVTEKLDEVRGQIEQQQAEFTALSKQVETVALAISLRAEADTQVFGLQWQPLYQLKLSMRRGIESVGDYAASMVSFLFYLPSTLLWLATILMVAALGWRILYWAGRLLFAARVPKPV